MPISTHILKEEFSILSNQRVKMKIFLYLNAMTHTKVYLNADLYPIRVSCKRHHPDYSLKLSQSMYQFTLNESPAVQQAM